MKKTLKLKPYAEFLFEVGVLERTPRSGFRHLGDWHQSVSEHLLRTSYIGYSLGHLEKEKDKSINVHRIVELCMFHDLAEARASDLDYINQKYSKTDELKAIEDAVGGLIFGKDIIDSFKESDAKITKEGIIAKDADQIELLCTLKEIMDNGNKEAKAWLPPLLKRLKTKTAQKLAKEILKTNSNDWWYKDKKGSYWITGGKRIKTSK